MNLRDIAEIAVLVAWFGQTRNSEVEPIPESFLKDFWRSSQLRCHLWHQDHIRYGKQQHLEDSVHLLEEIVVSEMLTRVSVGVMCYKQADNYRHFGERVIEHEHKLKHMLLKHCYSDKESIGERLRLERLQRRVERWTDLLVSPFLQKNAPNKFAMNKNRCEEYSAQGTYQNRITSPDIELSVFLSSARLVIPNRELVDETRSLAQRNILNLSLTLIPIETSDEQGLQPRLLQAIANSLSHESQQPLLSQTRTDRLS